MTAREKPAPATAVSRRRFVTLVAAGSAALLAPSGVAAPAPTARHKRPGATAGKSQSHAAAPAPPPTPAQKEFDRQRAGTLTTLKTLREFPLPPGGDLPVVFRPQRARKREG